MVIPLFVGEKDPLQHWKPLWREASGYCLLPKRMLSKEDPGINDVYRVGTVSKHPAMLKLPDGTVKVLVEGDDRVRIKKFREDNDYLQAENIRGNRRSNCRRARPGSNGDL